MLDDMYPRDIYLTEGYAITLEGDSRLWLEFRPDLDYDTIRGNAGIPTLIQRGIFHGFSLPIWAADAEELYLDICVPDRWDGASNIHVHMDCFVIGAQDAANDAFNLQLVWENYTPGIDIVPATNNPLTTETTTGICNQFQSFQVGFEIPFAGIEGDDMLAFLLRRVDVAIGNEIDGELVIHHVGVIFRTDILGNPDPY